MPNHVNSGVYIELSVALESSVQLLVFKRNLNQESTNTTMKNLSALAILLCLSSLALTNQTGKSQTLNSLQEGHLRLLRQIPLVTVPSQAESIHNYDQIISGPPVDDDDELPPPEILEGESERVGEEALSGK